MKIFGDYKFTSKKHPELGIMSTVLGAISLLSVILTVLITFFTEKEVSMSYGLACLLAFIMAIVGEIFGIITQIQKDSYRFFPLIGIILNGLSLAIGILFIVAGVCV